MIPDKAVPYVEHVLDLVLEHIPSYPQMLLVLLPKQDRPLQLHGINSCGRRRLLPVLPCPPTAPRRWPPCSPPVGSAGLRASPTLSLERCGARVRNCSSSPHCSPRRCRRRSR